MAASHHVVIIGGGFGGIQAARALRRANVRITLIDRRNFHLFQPLLYQVATGGLSPANIAAPLRKILSSQRNCHVRLGEVTGIDVADRTVQLGEQSIGYDSLFVAAGAGHSYFGHDDWERWAPGLKTIEDATEIRARILTAFETAETLSDPSEQASWLTFVVVGGGPTGVELAGALAEISRHTLKHDFRAINPASSQVCLIEAGERILPAFPEALSTKAAAALARLGVSVRTRQAVTEINADRVTVNTPAGSETIEARTVLWAAGVKASPLAQLLATATGAAVDRAGRIVVNADLTLPNHPEICVIGDMANYTHGTERPLPGVAPVAMQQGVFVAKLVQARLNNDPLPTFVYHDRGNLATIGRSAAVADFGWLWLSGFTAWVLWLVVHLLNIVTFRNRLLVFIQWGWSYLSWDRAARLITGNGRVLEQGKDTGDVPLRAQ